MPPRPNELRENIRIERRSSASDGGGGQTSAWATHIASRRAKLLPTRTGAGEEVLAGRLQGRGIWDCWVRYDSAIAAVTPDDRVTDNRDTTRVWNIRSVMDMDGDRRWLFLQLERGVA